MAVSYIYQFKIMTSTTFNNLFIFSFNFKLFANSQYLLFCHHGHCISGEIFDYLLANGRMKERDVRAKFRQVRLFVVFFCLLFPSDLPLLDLLCSDIIIFFCLVCIYRNALQNRWPQMNGKPGWLWHLFCYAELSWWFSLCFAPNTVLTRVMLKGDHPLLIFIY